MRCKKFFGNFDPDEFPFYAEQAFLKSDYSFDAIWDNVWRLEETEPDLYEMNLITCYCAALQPENTDFAYLNINIKSLDEEYLKKIE